jgi:SAM-dependent methyltransferase
MQVSSEGPFWLEIRRIAQQDNSGRAYNALYEERSLAQIPSFYLWLMDQFDLPSEGKLLDVSCGSGELVRLVAKRGLTAIGVDFSQVVARRAYQQVQPEGAIGVSVGECLPFPSSGFDFVTCIGSLEHFVDMSAGASEMARVLRPGGRAFILVPNTFSLLVNVWIAFRQGITVADEQPVQRCGARADWTRLLEANGLTVKHTIKYERPFPRVKADWIYYARRPKEILRLIATPFVPLNLAFHFLFVCERSRAD